ncbi:hypothetical protein V3C99_012314 [Haemonchus contortus]
MPVWDAPRYHLHHLSSFSSLISREDVINVFIHPGRKLWWCSGSPYSEEMGTTFLSIRARSQDFTDFFHFMTCDNLSTYKSEFNLPYVSAPFNRPLNNSVDSEGIDPGLDLCTIRLSAAPFGTTPSTVWSS